MGHTFTSSELYLYGASTKELSAAFWIAMNHSVPAGNVTGDLDVATAWASNSKPVVVVGNVSLDNMMSSGNDYTNFCNIQDWYNSSAKGPTDGCASSALDSLELSNSQI